MNIIEAIAEEFTQKFNSGHLDFSGLDLRALRPFSKYFDCNTTWTNGEFITAPITMTALSNSENPIMEW